MWCRQLNRPGQCQECGWYIDNECKYGVINGTKTKNRTARQS